MTLNLAAIHAGRDEYPHLTVLCSQYRDEVYQMRRCVVVWSENDKQSRTYRVIAGVARDAPDIDLDQGPYRFMKL
jgi:hypothetical protein